MDINELSFKEKIGQRFIFGINSNDIDDIIYLIKNYGIGGVILYRKNYNNYNDMLEVIRKLKDANKENKIPLFIAIDQEWGVVNRLPSEIHNLKNIYEMSRYNDNLVYDSTILTGKILKSCGINMNLAPVLDIYNNSNTKNLYRRCFYGDYDNVTRCGTKYINGLNKEGIISVCKHFPGHGISKADSHLIIPYIFDYKKVLNRHIIPFATAIDNGTDAIMVGHLIIRKLSGLLPASISKKFITKYLRNIFNYNGIVMTDEINMLSRNIFYKFIYLRKAVLSDNDIILVKINDKKHGISMINKIYKMNIDNDKLNNNVERILNIKKKYNISDNINYNHIDIDKINEEIDKINHMIK